MTLLNPLGWDLFGLVLWLIEYGHELMAMLVIGIIALPRKQKKYPLIALPILIGTIVSSMSVGSWQSAVKEGYSIFSQPTLRAKLEHYIATPPSELPEGAYDPLEVESILESKTYAPSFGYYELKYLIQDLLRHTIFHLDSHNEDNIDEGYNKGNDWFARCLGPTMMYTTGLYPTGEETLEEAQNHKIDYVADALQLEPGHKLLDIGCGWSYTAKRLSEVHGANVTGITLSKEQWKFAQSFNKNNPNVNVYYQNAMLLGERTDLIPADGGFDRIISLEMAEHVGIRRYQEFLTLIRNTLLKDDGVFYFQVAGLRRAWHYEDFVWGLFMGENVFPGADASCPLGWVVEQVERAGFEVQRTHNMGSHYSRTLQHWLDNWRTNEEYITNKYGGFAYRRWEVFLAWSVRVARQGSSTLFMLTLTKAHDEPRRLKSQAHVVPRGFENQQGFDQAGVEQLMASIKEQQKEALEASV
mmetsp:Transcript_39421/g.95383  ORF Transcript_39421/g.95383 Transcript_39421/m.95383 type:complete len:470 (-) Transcript_39421:402-1811(-)|eukprot:CAMPEP_0113631024 /NCGR_PEP_ID=MMETSP0017_2-20120614/16123_1 /TAXON_ID=2856 /ORGANISM="Cylindrotheca closterium" /LENGTH=469 /DNA_ID=CAMNT_0000541519 /DNA_START=71 /DNA_END=1480 /DNA_ORIENTATION=+ /assembly_acc=CAM_ASM_000147